MSAAYPAPTPEDYAQQYSGKREGGSFRCVCPNCGTNALIVSHGKAVPSVLQCFGCEDREGLLLALKADGMHPSGSNTGPRPAPRVNYEKALSGSKPSPTQEYARQIWAAALDDWDATASHPYTKAKRLKHAPCARRGAVTGRLLGYKADCLLIPARDLSGELIGVEAINATGQKQTFGNKGVLIMGNDLDPELWIYVVEGYASTVSVLDTLGWNACAAMVGGKSMLDPMADKINAHYPAHQIVIVREHDGK
ncbi:MAG: hypothetical protein ABJN62_18725 [Halioglobus sp.]